jgi:hypothetical protein
MKLAIMQPYFFPYIGYYQGISAVDKYMLYDNLAYIKYGWVNRNRVLVIHGHPVNVTVPVQKKSSYSRISEIELVDSDTWRKKILRTLVMNYRSSPFFDDVYPVIEAVICSEVKRLTELNARSIIDLCKYLGIDTEITTDTSKYFELEEKLADDSESITERFPQLDLRTPEKKVIRVIEICRAEGANVFINAIGGQGLYGKDEFARHGIELFFLRTEEHSYPQASEVFHPNLSIIDVLMNCGKDGTKELLDKYSLT